MTTALPRFIALNFSSRYVQFRPKQDVELTSENLFSERAYTRFEVVPDSRPGSNRIHIRTCYNNKFWTRSSQNQVQASEDEPQPDDSKPLCTSFTFSTLSNNRVSFQHAGVSGVWAQRGANLYCGGGTGTVFNFIDLVTLVALPRHVSFKGDNDIYLKSEYIRTRNRLQFGTTNPLDPKAHFEAFHQSNGDVRLRSITFNRFWRKSNPEWIWCDNTDNDGRDRDTLFRPVRLSTQSKTIGLISLGNNKYCKRRVRGGQPRLIDTLIASASSLVPQAVLEVGEAIRDREIYDIRYKLDLARKYNVQPVWVEPRELENDTNVTTWQTANFTYRRVRSETFSSSHSWKVSVEGKLTVNVIPLLVQGEYNWNASYEGQVKWDKTNLESIEISHGQIVPVPPMTRSVVTLIVERGTIDVPYSYQQRDVLLDGRHVVNTFDDGLFTGVNTYYTTYNVRHFPLNPKTMQKNEEEEEEEEEKDEGEDDGGDEEEYAEEEKKKKRGVWASSRL